MEENKDTETKEENKERNDVSAREELPAKEERPAEKDERETHDDLVQKKVICALAYLFGILFFLPLIVYPKDDFAKFHANQSLVVLLVSVIGGAVLGVLTMIPVVGILFTILSSLFGVVMLVVCILGILNVVREEKKELPVIGKITIIK